MATSSVGEQVELLFLDAVFHIAACAVELVLKLLRVAFEIDHDIEWVWSLAGMLGTCNHAALKFWQMELQRGTICHREFLSLIAKSALF